MRAVLVGLWPLHRLELAASSNLGPFDDTLALRFETFAACLDHCGRLLGQGRGGCGGACGILIEGAGGTGITPGAVGGDANAKSGGVGRRPFPPGPPGSST